MSGLAGDEKALEFLPRPKIATSLDLFAVN